MENNTTETPDGPAIPCTALFADFVRRHAIAIDDLTQEQIAEALRQAMPDFRRNIYANAQSVVYLPGSEAEKWRPLYHELLWAVGSKYEGESRHETALRYIRERETHCEGPAEEPLGASIARSELRAIYSATPA